MVLTGNGESGGGRIERTVAIYPKEVTPELFEAYKQAGAEHIILTSAGPFDMADLETLLSWR